MKYDKWVLIEICSIWHEYFVIVESSDRDSEESDENLLHDARESDCGLRQKSGESTVNIWAILCYTTISLLLSS